MGKIFSFVGSDVKTKIEILEELRVKDKDGHITSVKKMILYEKQEDMLRKKHYVSGSRTLLRLHRGLGTVCIL
jgi:hypothetical protein